MNNDAIFLTCFLFLMGIGLGWQICSLYRDSLERRERQREDRFRAAQARRVRRTWNDYRLIRRDGRPVQDLPDLDEWADQSRPANERRER